MVVPAAEKLRITERSTLRKRTYMVPKLFHAATIGPITYTKLEAVNSAFSGRGTTDAYLKASLVQEIARTLPKLSVEQLKAVLELVHDEEDEAKWDAQFAASRDVLQRLADRAEQQVREGKVYAIDEE